MKVILVLATILAMVAADCYMQNPRGSNDRNNEANENRDNANRLFDSQNNAKGGYCRGPAMTFYAGSLIQVQWTVQHGCGRNPALMCNMVIQYMCSPSDATADLLLRDGTTTNTITDDTTGFTQNDTNGNFLYGMHEPYFYYQLCKGRDRNQGLFIADRENQGGLDDTRRSAIYTRQNNNGDRHGFECTEERDYYPYWGPSIWHDVAILTQNTDWCSFYTTETQNKKDRGYCTKSATDTSDNQNADIYARYITQADCTKAKDTWVTVTAWGESAPDCVQTPFTRENHLGNGFGGFEASYNWTVPSSVNTNWTSGSSYDCVSADNCNCALRIRYNISTSDGSTDSETNFEEYHDPVSGFIDSTKNGKNSPFYEDPYVTQDGNMYRLAIDTTQFGRTFQDRTHMFHISPRPSGVISTARIHNLNVAGKRGNIVQAYPATEYKFQPQFLYVKTGDYVHFQWTGCDTNPAGNAGEGTAQTDRSNIIQMKAYADSYPVDDTWISNNPNKVMFRDTNLRMNFGYLGQTNCLASSTNADNNDPSNCFKLNRAPAYFDGGLVLINSTDTGTYYYMASRNNNFSNRGHKAVLGVDTVIPTWAIGTVIAGACLFLGASVIGGMIMHARSAPHGKIANLVNKL